MTPFLLSSRTNWPALLLVILLLAILLLAILLLPILLCQSVGAVESRAEEFREALEVLGRADAGSTSQIDAQQAWQVVATEGTAKQIPKILVAMQDVGPLAGNWLRAAADTIAERELRETGSLPPKLFESFALDLKQSPRARRIAYEWLAKVDTSAQERLLPKMLDDPSLELRYDALSRLLDEAKTTDDEQVKLQKYRRALHSARDIKQLKTCAEALRELGQTPDMAQEMGFLTNWKVIGPFDNTERAGFDKVFLPEQEIDLQAEYDGKSGPVKWKDAEAEQKDLKQLGHVDLNAAIVEEKNVLAYAYTTFIVAEDMQVECRYETIEATKLWVNGKEIAAKNVYHSGYDFDQYIVSCQLKRGENRILIKVCQNEQTQAWTQPWEFRLRITDKLGGAIQQARTER